MDDISFLVASHIPRANHRVAKHLVGYATIQYMDQGSVYVSYDDREYTIEGRWFWPAYPGPYVTFHPASGCESWSHRHLAFQGPLVSQWMADGIWPTEPQRAPESKNWAEYFDEMARLALMPSRWGRLRGLNMLEGLLLELAEARQAELPRDPWLESVLASLRQGQSDYQTIAEGYGMSLTTFRRRFTKATGVPIHQHGLVARIAKARTLLAETDLPIKAISDSLGYNNVYYFTRQFKHLIGMPPGQFRKSR